MVYVVGVSTDNIWVGSVGQRPERWIGSIKSQGRVSKSHQRRRTGPMCKQKVNKESAVLDFVGMHWLQELGVRSDIQYGWGSHDRMFQWYNE